MKNLLHEFFNSQSDACPLEASQQEKLEKEFEEWYNKKHSLEQEEKSMEHDFNKKEFIKVVNPLIKYLAENHHPHTTIIIDSTHAELVEGVMAHTTQEFLVD